MAGAAQLQRDRQRLAPHRAEVPRLPGRAALRARTAPARTARSEGRGARPGPAERRGLDPLPRLEPRLRTALEQPGASAGSSSAETGTRWVADSARQIDYWVTAGSRPRSQGATPTRPVTRPCCPRGPPGSGSRKLRYRTQEELLAVAREYTRRGLPLSVIVCDFFHWPHLGDWDFDAERLAGSGGDDRANSTGMGVKLMVSVWPSVSPLSRELPRDAGQGLLIGERAGAAVSRRVSRPQSTVARRRGVLRRDQPAGARLHVGEGARQLLQASASASSGSTRASPSFAPATRRTCASSRARLRRSPTATPASTPAALYEGMRGCGEDEIIALCRSAWAGSQRYGAAVWSGDIGVTFETLRAQIRGRPEHRPVSGIPWWTTDIGGFHGGDPDDPDYRELFVRWFQFGALCPLFRLHGDREPRTPFTASLTGGPNEVWSYGEQACGIIAKLLLAAGAAAALHPRADASGLGATAYRRCARSGSTFPGDEAAWTVEDAFCFGPDVLVAPVAELGARQRPVYLPRRRRLAHTRSRAPATPAASGTTSRRRSSASRSSCAKARSSTSAACSPELTRYCESVRPSPRRRRGANPP